MKRSRFYIGMMLLLVAGLPVGCSHDVDLKLGNEIAVTTRVTGMQKRVVAVNDANLDDYDIKIDAYFHDTEEPFIEGAKLHYDDSEWKFWDDEHDTQIHYYWPIEGSVYDPAGTPIPVSSLDFVGYCPFTEPAYITSTSYNHSTGASFTCDMSSYMTLASQSTMQEYVIAVLNEQTLATQEAAGGALPLQFKHPLAQVKFVINAASGSHVRIDSIGIDGLHITGTCTYDGTDMTWTSLSGDVDMSLDGVNLTVAGTTETDTIFVIPNTYNTHLTVKCTWTEWSNVTISDYGTDISFDWEPGHSYIYNLTVDKYGLKVDVQKYTEQW